VVLRHSSSDVAAARFVECVLDLGIERAAALLERMRSAAKTVGTTNN
jgi:hypothetical protein